MLSFDIKKFKPTEQLSFWGLGLTILIIIVAFAFIDVNTFQDSVIKAGIWAPIIFILLKISTIVFAPLSGSPLYLIVGVLFGFWPGLIYIIIGDFLGYTIAFSISRFFGYPLVDKFIARNEHGLLSKIINHLGTTKGMYQVCLTCFPMPELISYGAGLSKMKYIKFISILMPLSAIAASVLVLFGSKLGDLNNFLTLNIIAIPIIIILIVTGGSLFIRTVKNTKN